MAAIRALVTAQPRHTALALVLALLGALIEGAGLLLLVPILGVLTGANELSWVRVAAARWGFATPGALMGLLVAGFVAMMIVRALLLYARDMTLQSLQYRFVDAQRLRVMRALAVAPWAKVAALDHSRVTTLLGLDMTRVGSTAQMMVQVCVGLITLGVQLAVVAALSPAMAGIAVAVIVVGGGMLLLLQRHAFSSGHKVMRAGQSMMSNAAGFLGGLKIAAAQRMRDRFVAEFAAAQARSRDSALTFQRGQARARLGFAIGSAFVLAAVVVGGVGLLGVAPARLIIVVLVFARMVGPVQQLQQSIVAIAFGLPAFAAVTEAERHFAAEPEPRGMAPGNGPIALDGVSYIHGDGGGLKTATLTIAQGSITGITGPSGGGKTTLIDVVTGLLAPQAGTVSVGGKPLTGGWGGAVAYVPQDGFMFHDTVRRNLDWGDDAIGEAAMHAAIACAGASEIVARMPSGLDSIVGERGALLSGGERQRLAIARALLRRPRLLILDEATNAIDEAGEGALLDRLAALDPRPTILIVAHRDSSLSRCDARIRVEDGIATSA
ncbi:MAG: ABC transporter ATP-binding protein [Sphingomonas sp.]|uniref:ATP-binding cassette domain-containing protein n=1 Tax=Sphingomonas sp. TaxID=28214 RepID=UPI001216D02A|nr:ABC transporter ATP-binding protein [Sphingomonas sp.]THD37239.1 MAG: ABC transporter ATP-binding protein [Sphingomonas sp.]